MRLQRNTEKSHVPFPQHPPMLITCTEYNIKTKKMTLAQSTGCIQNSTVIHALCVCVCSSMQFCHVLFKHKLHTGLPILNMKSDYRNE